MCFRPPSADAGRTCPECGEKNNQTDTVCSACGAALPEVSLNVPSAPGVPSAPPAPGAPASPKAPGAAAPPSVQKPPQAPQ